MATVNLWQVDISWSAGGGNGIDSILVDLGHDGLAHQPGAARFRTGPALRAIRSALDSFEEARVFERRIDSIKVSQTATTLVKAP